jgi:hypothetical protein
MLEADLTESRISSKCRFNIRQYFRTRAILLVHFWFVALFLLELVPILSPDLDFFAASDSRDSSSFFRALKTHKMLS